MARQVNAGDTWLVRAIRRVYEPVLGRALQHPVWLAVASVAIFELGDLLAGDAGLGGYWGYAVSVLIVVVFVISMEKVPGLNFVPSWFLGAGVFFGYMALKGYAANGDDHNLTVYTNIAVPELAACAVGLAYGWVTVTFRKWYEAKVTRAA